MVLTAFAVVHSLACGRRRWASALHLRKMLAAKKKIVKEKGQVRTLVLSEIGVCAAFTAHRGDAALHAGAR